MTDEFKSQLRGSVLQIVMAAVAGLGIWYAVVETRLSVLETRLQAQERSETIPDLVRRFGKIESRVDQIYLLLTAPR